MAEASVPIDPAARFNRLREKAKGEATAQTQGQTEALQRRFAQMGMLNSGASIKQEQLAKQRGAQLESSKLSEIDSLQEDEALRKQEMEEAKKFQVSEREAGQKFGADQAALARSYGSSEREAGQSFAKQMQDLGFSQQSALSSQAQQYAVDNQNKAQSFQKDVVLKMQGSQFATQLEEAQRQFDAQFEEDKRITNSNLAAAKSESKKKGFDTKVAKAAGQAAEGAKDIVTQAILNPLLPQAQALGIKTPKIKMPWER